MSTDIVARALDTYARTDYPATHRHGAEVKHDGKRYVVLRNVDGVVIAVYRVIGRITNARTTYNRDAGAFVTDGGFTLTLKRMKRYPAEVIA